MQTAVHPRVLKILALSGPSFPRGMLLPYMPYCVQTLLEKKKKKDSRKSLGVSIVSPSAPVEVVRKKRKERPEPREEE